MSEFIKLTGQKTGLSIWVKAKVVAAVRTVVDDNDEVLGSNLLLHTSSTMYVREKPEEVIALLDIAMDTRTGTLPFDPLKVNLPPF